MAHYPELHVSLRFWYVVHSEFGNPWAQSLLGGSVFDPGLSPFETLPTPEDIILGHFEVAREIWGRYGIILELHRDGVSPIYEDGYFDINLDEQVEVVRDIADFKWSKNQSCVNVYYVATLRNGLYDVVLGETQRPDDDDVDESIRHRAVSILMSGNPTPHGKAFWKYELSWSLAHELGHVFGLAHTFQSAWIERISVWPFDDETDEELSFNLMSYPHYLEDKPTESEMIERAFLTREQRNRACLTLLSRKCDFSWVSDASASGVLSDEDKVAIVESPADMIPSLRQEFMGVRNYPDLVGGYHAAWMG